MARYASFKLNFERIKVLNVQHEATRVTLRWDTWYNCPYVGAKCQQGSASYDMNSVTSWEVLYFLNEIVINKTFHHKECKVKKEEEQHSRSSRSSKEQTKTLFSHVW